MKINIKALVEEVTKEEIAKLKEEMKAHPVKEEQAFRLKKGQVYAWTMGAEPLKVEYLGTAQENPTIKPGSSVGKGYIFQFQDGKKPYVELGPRSVQKYIESDTNEATTTFVTPDGKTLSPDQQAKAKTAKPGTTIVTKKAGELTEKKEEEVAKDAEPVEDTPAETSAGISAELGNHISSAIDTAAKCIQSTDDKKYEKILGKVIKNLTAAQDSLEAVQQHETKIAEQAAVADEKSTAKYTQALRKALKGSFKNPEHIEAVVKKYQKVIKASKDKDPNKLAEVITAHALKEGFDRP